MRGAHRGKQAFAVCPITRQHPLVTVVHVRVAGCKGIVEIAREHLADGAPALQLELALPKTKKAAANPEGPAAASSQGGVKRPDRTGPADGGAGRRN